MTTILLLGFTVLFLLNVPVSFAMAISSVAAIVYGGIPAALVAQRMTTAIDSFVLLAVPFFLLAGHLMARSGIARDIIEFANALFGWARGGLAQANIGAGTLMGGMTGSAVAEASSTGGILIPPMKERGYDGAFCAAVTASASIISVVLPPSIPMIIFCVITGASVSRLFVAGIVPGILVALTLMLTVWVMSVIYGYPKGGRFRVGHLLRTARSSVWGLVMPLVIIGSIRYGIATPTEASVVAVVYALLVGMFVYRTIRLVDLPRITLEACVTTGVVMLMIATASLYGLIVTREQIPQAAAALILGISNDPTFFLILVLLIYVLAGTILDLGASIIILVPVLWPVTQTLGIDPLHFGILTVLGLGVGLVTPPVGASLFVTCGIAKCNLMEGSLASLPFVLALYALTLLIVFAPELVTWLPSRMN